MIASGQTPVGSTNWQVYIEAANAVFVDVDTAGFRRFHSRTELCDFARRNSKALGSPGRHLDLPSK